MSVETTPQQTSSEPSSGGGRKAAFGLLPLILLAGIVAAFFALDPLSGLRKGFPPVEELTFERVVLNDEPVEIVVTMRNGGPEPVTIAQVLVDEAYWTYEIDTGPELGRLQSATIRIPYPWVEGDTHELIVITSTGVTFDHEIGVATATPSVGGRELGVLAMLGVYVGVIPVFLGLLWYPFVRGLSRRWVSFFLALTAGLLVFLAVDAVHEALEIAPDVAGAFQGIGLITIGIIGALAALFGLSGWMRSRGGTSPLYVATLIAAGIGLHNLGEGLAIGSAYAIGEIGLTTFLILGFTLHNTTEGLGIVSPLAEDQRPRLAQLALLGLIAGGPTIAGAWLGGLAYNPAVAVLFLSIGAGAIVQVVWEIGKLMRKDGDVAAPLNAAGFLVGVAIMYATGIFVAA